MNKCMAKTPAESRMFFEENLNNRLIFCRLRVFEAAKISEVFIKKYHVFSRFYPLFPAFVIQMYHKFCTSFDKNRSAAPMNKAFAENLRLYHKLPVLYHYCITDMYINLKTNII